jgi:hypothetical protein
MRASADGDPQLVRIALNELSTVTGGDDSKSANGTALVADLKSRARDTGGAFWDTDSAAPGMLDTALSSVSSLNPLPNTPYALAGGGVRG